MIKYIAFEGIDCAGKGAQIMLLSEWLEKRDFTPIRLFEPTNGRYGRRIQKCIVEKAPISVARQIELFTKDREEHVRGRVRPLLDLVKKYKHFFIVQDRCYLSAPAYQADSEEKMFSLLRRQQAIAPAPDIIFLLDIPVDAALQRQGKSKKPVTKFDKKEVLERVRNNYLFLVDKCAERIEVIDGFKSREAVCADVTGILSRELKL